jgi:hypothetical protein
LLDNAGIVPGVPIIADIPAIAASLLLFTSAMFPFFPLLPSTLLLLAVFLLLLAFPTFSASLLLLASSTFASQDLHYC